jgi:acetyl esterase/lipase
MRYRPGLCCVATLLLFACWLHGGEAYDLSRLTPVPSTEQIPLADFFRPPIFSQPALNPSGTHIVAIVTAENDQHLLLVYDLKAQKQEAIGVGGDTDIVAPHWLDDRRLVFQVTLRKLYGIGFFAANIGQLSDCYPLFQFYGTSLVSVPADKRLRPLVWNSHDQLQTGRDLGVCSVNTDIQGKAVSWLAVQGLTWEAESARKDAMEHNQRHIDGQFPIPESGTVTGYMADKDGHLEYAFVTEGNARSLYRLAGSKWVKCPVNLEKTAVIAAGNQPGQLVASGGPMDGKPRPLRFLDAASGELGKTLIPDTAYDFVGSIYRDPISHEIIGAQIMREGPHAVWFNDAYRNMQRKLNASFPGVFVQILGSNEAQKLFLICTYSDRQPVIFHWVDFEKRAMGLIKNCAPWIDSKRMQPETIIKFKTRDGHSLDAYLTLPAGASKENPPPLVVLPHGGPWVRDNWGFDGEAQFLASRGYAVLKPNYRGSPGTGWMFPNGGDWDFLKMHYDVTDATKAIIASGLVDPQRVAIMGGSFGGWLAMEGLADNPELYRCAVTIAGVFDWGQFFEDKKRDVEHFSDATFQTMLIREGDPDTHAEKFAALSPLRHMDRVQSPVFVAHGGYDPIADIGQSKRLISELEKRNIPHDSYFVLEESHGMHHLANQAALYSRIEAFLGKYLMAAPPPSR